MRRKRITIANTRPLLLVASAIAACAVSHAQIIDAYCGLGSGGFQQGKGVLSRFSSSANLSGLDAKHLGIRYSDSLGGRTSMRFSLAFENFRFHQRTSSWFVQTDYDISYTYARIGMGPAFRPIQGAERLVLTAALDFWWGVSAHRSGTYYSAFNPDTSYTLDREPLDFRSMNISLESSLAYEIDINSSIGVAIGAYAGYGLFAMASNDVGYRPAHIGVRLSVFHRHLLNRFFD